MFIDKVKDYIQKNKLLIKSQKVAIGLSGGADSVALLAVLVRLGYDCVALHCNFHLRGKEADRDEAFAQGVAKHFGVPFHRIDFETRNYAEDKKISIEMAARELRYNWFNEMLLNVKAQAICVAHHQDDLVETFLMNLARGTGIRGAGGIRPKNGTVIRPLLEVSKKEILNWLDEQQLDYVTDSSNLEDQYTRNFYRLRVIPLIEEIRPSSKETLARSAKHLAAAEKIYLYTIEKARKECFDTETQLNINHLLTYPSPETILYELLIPFGFGRSLSETIFESLKGESGKLFYSPTHRLIKDREVLLLTPLNQTQTRSYCINKLEDFANLPIAIKASLSIENKDLDIIKRPAYAYLDLDKIQFPLVLRPWQQGDAFIPFGMKGRKKLSDYFSDHKYSKLDKEKAWLLCQQDVVLWLVNERIDNRFRILKDTKKILILHFIGEK